MVCQLCHLKSSVDYRGGYEIVDNFSQSDSEIIRFDSVSPTHDNLISMFPDDDSSIVSIHNTLICRVLTKYRTKNGLKLLIGPQI